MDLVRVDGLGWMLFWAWVHFDWSGWGFWWVRWVLWVLWDGCYDGFGRYCDGSLWVLWWVLVVS